MPIIGVRELRQQATEVLRQVREQRAEYVITHQGKPIALLTPVDAEAIEKAMLEAGRKGAQDAWARYEQLAEQVRRNWPADLSSETLLDDIRR